jgi:hypothetical protein
MPATSFRDRLLTSQGARAVMSPGGILLAGGVAAVAVVAGLPLVAAIPLGAVGWGANVVRRLPRGPRGERIDPFTLQEPWRRFVQEALQARTRFDEAVGRAPAGPLRDHLREIAARMETGVSECWLIARRGQTLVDARRGIDLDDVERQLAEATRTQDPSGDRVVQALEAQRATAQRLDGVIDQARSELRLLDARLDEAVARTLELSAHASTDTSVAGLGTDVDTLVTEMEALRQALEETTAVAEGALPPAPGEAAPGEPGTPGTPGTPGAPETGAPGTPGTQPAGGGPG